MKAIKILVDMALILATGIAISMATQLWIVRSCETDGKWRYGLVTYQCSSRQAEAEKEKKK